MSKRQEEIKDLLENADISQARIARRLGMSPQNLNYHLNESPDLDYDLYARLVNVISPFIIENREENLNSIRENLSRYIPASEADKNSIPERISYKIMGVVPAGIAELTEYNEWQQAEDLYYDPREHFYLTVDEEFGYSMMPLVSPGDLVLCSFNTNTAKNGDIVAARWDNTKGALKILNINPDIKDMIVLTSYNQAVEPIFVSKAKAKVYKVVLIKKRK